VAQARARATDPCSGNRPYHGEPIALPASVDRDPFFSSIYEAQFKPLPNDYGKMDAAKIAHVRENLQTSRWLPPQESGTRASCALPYELTANGVLSDDRKRFVLELAAGNAVFGDRASGAPFRVYAPGPVRPALLGILDFEKGRAWDYAVAAGDQLADSYSLTDFEAGQYHLRVDGPNGFFREFRGSADDPLLTVKLVSRSVGNILSGDAEVQLTNRDPHRPLSVFIEQLTYSPQSHVVKLEPAGGRLAGASITIPSSASYGWHDVRIRVREATEYEQRFAGRIETGKESLSDPNMAKVERA
jgi:phospholipase C